MEREEQANTPEGTASKSKNPAKDPALADAWRLYFLAWLDALEKLDILVLELRHLQHTCIFSLRAPVLQEVLRREEVILDPTAGENPDELFAELTRGGNSQSDPLSLARRVSQELVPLFPDPLEQPQDPPAVGEGDEPSAPPMAEVRELLRAIWLQGLWSDASKDLYQVLQSAQELKRQIICDRLVLFLDGYRRLGLADKRRRFNDQERFPDLLMARMAVLARSHEYLGRIGDLQQRLGQHLESTPAQYPRPSVHRRRMQGVYTQYLARRVSYLRLSMNLLLAHLRGAEEHLAVPKILHRWEHSHTSRQAVFMDEVGAAESDPTWGSHETDPRVEFVQTGFWMLDKPDNQPTLAHEVAHHAIRQHYDNLMPAVLGAAGNDHFAALIRDLQKVLKAYDLTGKAAPPQPVQELVNPLEIACDLLASAVKGVSYLYAFFLEAMGWGLEHAMVDEHGYLPHLSVRLELREDYNAPRVRNHRDWYLRGRVIVQWLRATSTDAESKSPTSPGANTIDSGILTAVEHVLEALSQRLAERCDHSRDQSHLYWQDVAKELCRRIDRSSAAREVKAWRESRRSDQYQGATRRRGFPRESQRLPFPVRRFLLRVLHTHKAQLYGKPATSHYGDWSGDIDRVLDRCPASWKEDRSLAESGNQLFLHVFDIPWQCAWIRAGDFRELRCKPHPDLGLEALADRTLADLYTEINRNTSLGRRLFFAAMEFDAFSSQSPCQRLRTLVREIRHLDLDDADRNSAVQAWLARATAALMSEQAVARRNSYQAIREIQKTQGECLAEFVRLLETYARPTAGEPQEPIQDCWSRWFRGKDSATNPSRGRELFHFLTLHAGAHHSDGGPRPSYEEYRARYTRLARYFDCCPEPSDASRSTPGGDLRMLLASRACVSGETRPNGEQRPSPLLSAYDPSLGIKPPAGVPSTPAAKAAESSTAKDAETLVATTGFYNALFLKPGVKHLCRCVLPRLRRGESGDTLSLPLFMRRESWIELSADAHPDTDLSNALCVLFLQLNRRFARLDFIDWLFSEGPRDEAGPLLSAADRVFLTDGWADVVLLLGAQGPTAERRRSDLFAIRGALGDHILVRRMETVFTRHVPPQAGFPTFISIRLDDTSPGRLSPRAVMNKLRAPQAGWQQQGWQPPRVFSLPGSTELTLLFEGPEAGIDDCLDYLRQAGVDHDLDRIMIQIGDEPDAHPHTPT